MSKNASKEKIKIRREMFKFEEMVKTAENLAKAEDNLITHQLAVDLCFFLEAEGLPVPEFATKWWSKSKPKGPPTIDTPPADPSSN